MPDPKSWVALDVPPQPKVKGAKAKQIVRKKGKKIGSSIKKSGKGKKGRKY